MATSLANEIAKIKQGVTVVGKANHSTDSDRLGGFTLGNILPKHMEIEIDTTNWGGTSPPFTKEIAIEGMTSEDTPLIGLITPKVTGGNIDMVRALQMAYGAMTIWETFGGKMLITCLEEKPQVTVKVQIEFGGARNMIGRAFGNLGAKGGDGEVIG